MNVLYIYECNGGDVQGLKGAGEPEAGRQSQFLWNCVVMISIKLVYCHLFLSVLMF